MCWTRTFWPKESTWGDQACLILLYLVDFALPCLCTLIRVQLYNVNNVYDDSISHIITPQHGLNNRPNTGSVCLGFWVQKER